MKIPASSSLLFATLAISSSSTSLAAPAGETSQATGMSTSSSNHHMASRRGSFNMARSDVEGATTVVQKRQVVNNLLCTVESAVPVVGSLLGPLLNLHCGSDASSVASEASVESVSSASGAADSGDDSNPDPNAPQSPSLPSQSPPPPPNTPLTGATDAAPVSPPSPPSPASQRRDVPGSIRGRSLPPRDGSADGDQKPLNATSPTPPSTTTDTPKAVAGSAESHSSPVAHAAEVAEAPVQSSPVSPPVNPSGNLPAGPAGGPSVDPGQAPVKPPVKAPVKPDHVPGAVEGNLSNAKEAAGAPGPAPPKRDSATPEW